MMIAVPSESGEAMVCRYEWNDITILLTEKLSNMEIMGPGHKNAAGSLKNWKSSQVS